MRPRARDRLEQGARVELARVSEHLGDGPRLDDAAVLEHRDGVGDLPHEGQVVRDEEIGESELLLQLEQHLEDPRLHGDIQRRCRLVEHDHVGLQHERAGDRDPLALAAGQCAGAPPRQLAAEPDGRECIGDRGRPLLAVADSIAIQRLAHDLLHAPRGIQRGERVLVDELEMTTDAAEVGVAAPVHRSPVHDDLAGVGLLEAEQQPHGGGLARARLAHEGVGRPGRDRERDIVDDRARCAVDGEALADCAHVDSGCGGA